MSNFIVDFQSKQLTLLDSRYYTTEEGGWVPSVTTILDAYPKDYGYFQWLKSVGEDADAIRDEAGRRGSLVHKLTEQYDGGEEVSLLNTEGNLQMKLSEWSMFERYAQFIDRCRPVIMMAEQNYVSQELGYAGTLDRVIEMNGRHILVDIKTSNAVYPSYWLQLAAYAELAYKVGGVNVDDVAILWLNAKTRTAGSKGQIQGVGWQLITKTVEDSRNDLTLFQHTHALWLAQNKDLVPKKLSYQLSYKK